MRTPIALTLAAGAALAAAAPAMAHQPVLFSQTARTGTVTPLSGSRADVVLATGHKAVVLFEERPGTRTGTVSERAFTGLWQGTFKTDAPNAVLTGAGPGGRDRRAIVRITGAAQVKSGVRYRVHILRGSLPATLHPANLMIDSVPLSAITAYLDGNSGRVNSYEPLINALHFPMQVVVQPQPQAVITPGNPLTVSGAMPTHLMLGQLLMYPGTQIIMTGNPGTVVASFDAPADQGCWPLWGMSFQLQVAGSDGSLDTLLPTSPGSGITQSVMPTGGNGCLVSWDLPNPPVTKAWTTVTRGADGKLVSVSHSITYQTTAVLALSTDAPGPLTLEPFDLSVG